MKQDLRWFETIFLLLSILLLTSCCSFMGYSIGTSLDKSNSTILQFDLDTLKYEELAGYRVDIEEIDGKIVGGLITDVYETHSLTLRSYKNRLNTNVLPRFEQTTVEISEIVSIRSVEFPVWRRGLFASAFSIGDYYVSLVILSSMMIRAQDETRPSSSK